MKKIIIAALCCIFVAACQTTPRVSSKTHIEHKEYGIMPKTDDRYVAANKACEKRVFGSGKYIAGTKVNNMLQAAVALKVKQTEIKSSKLSKEEQSKVTLEAFKDVTKVMELVTKQTECLQSKGYTQV